MFETFIERNFQQKTMKIIHQANAIIDEYQAAGFTLTLRQLYYQFVARDLLPNKQTNYDRLGEIISDARLAGLVDWDAIEDRTRFLRQFTTFIDPTDAITTRAENYIEDLWANQEVYFEVWIEKDALIGVIEPACQRWRIPYFACRGYASQSELYVAGKRLEEMSWAAGKRVVILHLGDHDPSGLDMTRDNDDRVTKFAGGEADISVSRLALNMDQVRRYRPPPNPAKESDSRITAYVDRYQTRSSWELDALDPKVIDKLIDDAVREEVDIERWNRDAAAEAVNRDQMKDAARRWGKVVEYLDRDDATD